MESYTKTNINGVLAYIQELKGEISNIIRSEMRRRKMNNNEISKLVGVSAPTLKKLITSPHSQSIALVEKVFDNLNKSF